MGGNTWRFKFCRNGDMPDCGVSGETTNWSGGLFFDSSSGNIRPIYTMPAVAKDNAGNLWVYWGTGDKTDPTASNAQEHLYGVKDNDRTSTYTVSDIDNITTASGTYDASSGRVGYRILLTGGGQKMLADPTVFGGVVYFTTYTPPSGSNPCEQGGVSSLFAINYATGGGALEGGARSMAVGTGIASAPVVSLPPDSGPPDLYVTTSGGGGASASTQRVNITPAGALNRTNMLYWWDQRIQ
jgi:Tfp pilus tip-associated adhesin PilY1